MRELVTTALELIAALLVITGVFILAGVGVALIVAGLIAAGASWALVMSAPDERKEPA